jgi:hypothetical protein
VVFTELLLISFLIIMQASILVTIICVSAVVVSSQQIQPTAQSLLFPLNSIVNKGNINEFGGIIPNGRVHHSLASSTNYVITYGGHRTDGSLINTLELYDKTTQQWSGVLSRTECCDAEGNILDTLGNGVSGNRWSESNGQGIHYDPEKEIDNIFSSNDVDHKSTHPTHRQKVGYSGDAPLARAEHSAAVVTNRNHDVPADDVTRGLHERMYVFGGVTQEYGYMNDLHYFDMHTLEWHVVDSVVTTNSPQAALPGRRAGHSMAINATALHDTNPNSNIHMTEFYVFGGRGKGFGKDVISYNDVWRFSVTTNQWTCLTTASQRRNGAGASTPAGRQYAAVTIVHDRLWVFGGVDPVSSVVYNDVWSFHLHTGQWKRFSDNSGSVTGYSPPPLYYAHLIPIIASNDVAPSAPPEDVTDQWLNATGASTIPQQSVGFFVYGGLGAGGSCARILNNQSQFLTQAVFCTPLELTSVGQMYKFTVDLSPEATDHLEFGRVEEVMNIQDLSIFDHAAANGRSNGIFSEDVQEDGGVSKVSWDYCRVATDSAWGADTLSISQTPHVGKYFKTYALERVVYDGFSGQVFELGGLTVLANTDLDTGGYLAPVSWDKHSGEELEDVGNLPVNTLQWIYSDAFSSMQPQRDFPIVKFLHTFKIFSIASSQDMVLLLEKYIE